MKVYIYILIVIVIFCPAYSQVGIGGGGGLNYPGFASSDLNKSRFVVGAGYDIFIRHRLIKIGKDHQLNARYSVSNYFSDIDLASVDKTRYYFNYLSVEILFPLKSVDAFTFVAGAGMNLVSITAVKKYTEDTNESLISPSVILGTEYWFSKSYNAFANLNFQYGKFKDFKENLSIHGLRFQIGATMFLTEQ